MPESFSAHVTDVHLPGQVRDQPGQVRPSATAEITCAQRAAESLRPAGRRLIDDPFARFFLRSRSIRARTSNRLVATLTTRVFDRLYPGFMAIVLLRNRWYEEELARALSDGITQVVLLGAGYDTTSLRINLGAATLYEVDAPPTQQAKLATIRAHELREISTVRYVSCDFERDVLVDQLTESGFNPADRALFVWYGVTFFISEAAVRKAISDVAGLSAEGSMFMFDYMDSDVITGSTRFKGARRGRVAVIKRGEPYTFGSSRDGAEELVRSAGFSVRSHVRISDLAQRYGGERDVWFSRDDFVGIITGQRVGS